MPLTGEPNQAQLIALNGSLEMERVAHGAAHGGSTASKNSDIPWRRHVLLSAELLILG